MSPRVAVLGGGVAGVTVAAAMAERGVGVDVFEASSRLGGLHRSITLDGFCFDIGAFIFSAEHELLRCFPFLAEHFVPAQPGYARITPSGRLDSYPLTVAGYLRDEGLLHAGVAGLSLLASKVLHRRKNDVAAYAKYYMGSQVYRRSGLQRYIERLYGIPDTEVGLEFAIQRLKTLERYTPRTLIESQLRPFWNRLSRRTSPTSSRALVRPVRGFSFVYSLVQRHLEALGVGLHFEAKVEAIRKTATGFSLDVDGQTRTYERVISTIPIPAAQRLMGMEPWTGFETMSLYSMFYTGTLKYENAIQYNFTDSGRWKRLTRFSKYYGRQDGLDFWVVETTTRDQSPVALKALRDDFEQHARGLGLFTGDASMVGDLVTENAYPVFRRGYSERLGRERGKLTKAGLDTLGRQGAFEYLSSLETAAKARQLGTSITFTDGPEPARNPDSSLLAAQRGGST